MRLIQFAAPAFLVAWAVTAVPQGAPASPAPKPKQQAPAAAAPTEKQAQAGAAIPEKRVETPAETREGPSEAGETPIFEGFGKTPDEQADYKDFSDVVRHYEAESKEFRKDVQLLIEKKYDQKRASLSASYEKAIRDIEVLERKDRLDAIAMLEEFLERYCPVDRPDQCIDQKYVPDVIFRLAELYYERSQDQVTEDLRKYEEQLKLVQEGKLAAAPPEPQANYTKAIAQYQRLITQFPGYRLLDGAYYLLAYCLEKQNEFDQSQETYQRLIEKFPQSKFVPEAWVRMGEYYFDAVKVDHALDRAALAYTKATEFKDHPLYDKALYKLGWTYYRMDKFDEAVDAFIKLIDFYEQKSKEAGADAAGGDLRTEAMQYTAISFTDEKWGSLAKAEDYFRRIGPRPYESQLYRSIGDVFFDQTKFKDAIAAYKLVIARDPLNKDAPLVQDKVVKSCERLLDNECAARERQEFARLFAQGSPWEVKNKHDPDAIKAARDLVEKSLYSSAVFHHQQAIADKQAGKADLALREFQLAAQGYAGYLEKFPHSKQAYELSYYYADCLYNSLQFLAAAKAYEAVRDSTVDNRYQSDATFAVVLAYQKAAELDERLGKVAKRAVRKAKERREGEGVTPLEIPPIWQSFIKAADRFLALQPKHDKAAGIAYKAAELFYAYDQFDEARKRFDSIVKNYPDTEVAQFAGNLILETYLAENNYPKVLEYTEVLKSRLKRGGGADVGGLVALQNDIRFKIADQYLEKKQWDKAAKAYLDVVAQNPKYENADKALNNAAVAFENSRRFDSALRIYERIYNEYPKSTLADSALFRVGINAENSYDYDKAVDRYKLLIEKYPGSKNREAAVNNAARLLNALQRYREAALMNERYAALFPKSDEAPKALYRAALILDKVGDNRGEIKALDDFTRKFSRDPDQVELVVEAQKRVAEAYEKLGNHQLERDYLKKTVQIYDQHQLGPDKVTASKAAAEAKLKLLEDDFAAWDRIKITGRAKELEKSFKNKLALAKKLQDSYNDIVRFKNVEAILAAFYKKAYCLERLENTLTESGCPADIKRRYGEEGCIVYQEQLVQKVTGVEEAAVKYYQDTLEQCKNYKLMENENCERTLESLNRFRPDEYHVLKKAKTDVTDAMNYPMGLAETPEGPKVQKTESKLGEEEK
jgi:cellulose synthase operon protein C